MKRFLSLALAVLMTLCASASAMAEAGWPLEEQQELEIWLVWSNDFVENIDALKAIQQIEKNTNVKVNWTYASRNEAATSFSMMIMDEQPDIIIGADNYYSGGVAALCDDGISVELTDKIQEYMPNYYALVTSDDNLLKDVIDDQGRFVAAYTLASHNGELGGEKPYGGTVLRRDWLEALELEVPVTMDDWYHVLTEVHKAYPDVIPLMLPADGVDIYNTFLSAYGVLSEFYQENGVVKYGPAEPGYRQWVETMRQWYADGLIDPNFITVDANADYFTAMDYIGGGKAFAGNSMWGYTAENMRERGYNNDEDFYLLPVAYPVLNAGDTPQAGMAMSDIVKPGMSITFSASSDKLELAMKYVDYWFSNEGMMLDCLGIEGESYTDNGDGTYSLTDQLIQLVADGVYPTKTEAVYSYTLGNYGFGLYSWGRFDAIYAGQNNYKAYDIWGSAAYDLVLPTSAVMNSDETSAYSAVYANIQTLVQENTVKFIIGTKSMDEYDSFVAELYQYGLEECLAYKQASLDRYNSRSVQ